MRVAGPGSDCLDMELCSLLHWESICFFYTKKKKKFKREDNEENDPSYKERRGLRLGALWSSELGALTLDTCTRLLSGV